MSGLQYLPDELQLQVCRHLQDVAPATLLALARTCKRTRACAFEVYNTKRHIDLANRDTVHQVLEHLSEAAKWEYYKVPKTPESSIGLPFAEKFIRYASKYTSLSVKSDIYSKFSPVKSSSTMREYLQLTGHLKTNYMYRLDPYWDNFPPGTAFAGGYVKDFLYLLLGVAQHLVDMEVSHTFDWVPDNGLPGTCMALQNLRLSQIQDRFLPQGSMYFLTLLNLRTLEFTEMLVGRTMLLLLWAPLSVTKLRFVNCPTEADALVKIVSLSLQLETFEYEAMWTDLNVWSMMDDLRMHCGNKFSIQIRTPHYQGTSLGI